MRYSRYHHQYNHYHRVVRRNYGRLAGRRFYGLQHNEFQAHQPNFNYLDEQSDPSNHHRRYVREQRPPRNHLPQQLQSLGADQQPDDAEQTIRRLRRSLSATTHDLSAIIAADIVNPNRRNGHKRRLKRIQK